MKHYGWKIIVLIVLAVFVFLWLVKAPIMASYLTRMMGVDVSIGSVSMWPSQTTIHSFKIKNPRGFKTKTAFKVSKIQVKYNFKQLRADPTEIDLIEMDDIFLSIEFTNPLGTSNNWTAIGANMPQSDKPKKEVIIHRLVLNNTTVQIRGLGLVGAPTTKTIPYMEFDEINSKEGFPTKELIQKIFGGAGLQQYIQDAFNPQKIIQKYLPFKLGSENELEKEKLEVR